MACKRCLWQRGMGAIAEDVGGEHARSLGVVVGSLDVSVTNPSRPVVIL
ncbi:MAG: hypothetical protein HRU17_07145 [Polyangiaceae bacterium]|nr:hypothetical protein [Polyangiaceae bacterium]